MPARRRSCPACRRPFESSDFDPTTGWWKCPKCQLRAFGGNSSQTPSVVTASPERVDEERERSAVPKHRSLPVLPAAQEVNGFPGPEPATSEKSAPTTLNPSGVVSDPKATVKPGKAEGGMREKGPSRIIDTSAKLFDIKDGVVAEHQQLAERARAAATGLVRSDEWFECYINPYEALQIDEILVEGAHKAKVIQRAKNGLLREIDLDGKVPWLDDYPLDKSRAQKLDDDLLDPTKARYHWSVFQNRRLLRFLTRGDIEAFLYSDGYAPDTTLDQLNVEPGFRAFLSKAFARQYNVVLTRAIEGRLLPVVQVVLAGGRWVEPADEDSCLEGAYRRVGDLVELMRVKTGEGRLRKVSFHEMENFLRQHSLPDLFNLLPPAFVHRQREVIEAIRHLALSYNNEHDDAELSKTILGLCRRFTYRDIDLTKRLEEDFKTLEENILAKRLSTLVELMRAKEIEGRTRKISFREIEDFLQQHSFSEVFNPLPADYACYQTGLVNAIRSLAITCNNEHGDVGLSMGVLGLCKRFTCQDIELTKRLEEDFEAIKAIMFKQQFPQRVVAEPQRTPHTFNRSVIWVWLVIGLIIILGVVISKFNSTSTTPNGIPSTSRPLSHNPPSDPGIPALLPKPIPPVDTAKAELDRDGQVIDNEKTKTKRMATALESLDQEIAQERSQLDRTNQFTVDQFNRKVDTYNAQLEKLRAQERLVNRLVDSYNEKLRQMRR
jgi:hypothetical protein